jgi:SWI/SNF-related matrix-associated actin-dependent regulator of chromatin subfamily A3
VLQDQRITGNPYLKFRAHDWCSIIFSFWKKSLDLVGELFAANEVRYCRVDGSLSLGRRKTVLSEFQRNHEVGVLLMTLGTGAVGYVSLSISGAICGR